MVFVMWAELVSNRFDRLLLGLRATPTNLQLLYSIYFFRVKRERSFLYLFRDIQNLLKYGYAFL